MPSMLAGGVVGGKGVLLLAASSVVEVRLRCNASRTPAPGCRPCRGRLRQRRRSPRGFGSAAGCPVRRVVGGVGGGRQKIFEELLQIPQWTQAVVARSLDRWRSGCLVHG